MPNYITCAITVLSDEIDFNTKEIDIRIDEMTDDDENDIIVDHETSIQMINVHPEDRSELRAADEDDEISIRIDRTWIDSEGIL